MSLTVCVLCVHVASKIVYLHNIQYVNPPWAEENIDYVDLIQLNEEEIRQNVCACYSLH